jgi:hypothetical protein
VDVDDLDPEALAHLDMLRGLNPTESGLLDSYSSSFDPRDAIGENTFSGASRVHTPNGVARLTVRTGPGFRYARSFQLSDGERVTIIDSNDSETWLKVRTSSDQEGWILAAYIQPDLVSEETTQSTEAECLFEADSELDDYWNYDALGCALGPSRIIWAAWETFEGGYTLWRRDRSKIYGFFSDGSWVAVDDTWDQRSIPTIDGTPPPGLQKPVRGFAYIWSTNPRFSDSLGWATDGEKGFCAVIQDFEGGFILKSSQIDSCHEESLHNHAREETFGLKYVVASWTGTWFRQ